MQLVTCSYDEKMSRENKAVRNAFDYGGLHELMPDKEIPQMRTEFEHLTQKLLPAAKFLLQCLELGLGK